jgi:DNA-binding response OmpR family regulator
MMDQIRILLVEDNEDEAFLLALAMKDEHRARVIEHARDGEIAVAYLAGTGDYANRERHPLPDVVLLDLNMPRVNGFEVLQWLRAQPERPQVVVFTSSQREDDHARCIALGADDFIVKPIDMTEFRVVLSTLITRVQERVQAPPRAI